MHYHVENQWLEMDTCANFIDLLEPFVARTLTEENVRQRKAYHFTNRWGENARYAASAYAIHCPGGKDSDNLPGFLLSELPEELATLTRRACKQLDINAGRVFLNIAFYGANCGVLEPHFDGELFDFSIVTGSEVIIRRSIRPEKVAVLTLQNDISGGGTQLYPQNGDQAFTVEAAVGDLLVFSNIHYQHGAIETLPGDIGDKWQRIIIGWRAFEDNCYQLEDDELSELSVAEAAQLHQNFLQQEWPDQVDAAVEEMSR